MRKLQEKMKTNGTVMTFDESSISLLSKMSYEPQYGARPVKRAINNHIINGITMKILSKEITKDRPILISANDGGFLFTNTEDDERTSVSSDETTFA